MTLRWLLGRFALRLAPHLSGALLFVVSDLALGAPQSRPLADPGKLTAGFTPMDPTLTGITFSNRLSERTVALNRMPENGSGVALGDVDGDGRCDVYLCGLDRDNALYRNLGDWRFEDITEAAGVACPRQWSSGAVLADVEGDGDLDLLVNSLGSGTQLWLNNGNGVFTESPGGRLVRRFGATSLALADMDGDGDLDLYVTNYRTDTFRDDPPGLKVEATKQKDGRITVIPEGRFIVLKPEGSGVQLLERGERDFLYLNQGEGKFAPVSWTQGAILNEDGEPLKEPSTDWGLAVAFRDLNGDGWPDLYVCNDFVYWPDRVWLNRAGQGFAAAPRFMFRNQSLSSMAVEVADFDRDGHYDLFVAEMRSRRFDLRAVQRPNVLEGLVSFPKSDPQFRPEVTRNTLQWARGDGTFAEIACRAGVAATEWTWSAVALDVDLDGFEDLLIANGNYHDVQHADVLAAQARDKSPRTIENRVRDLRQFPSLPNPRLAYRNLAGESTGGIRFADATAAWRFDDTGIAHGAALADLDDDGDLDVVINRLHQSAAILRNDSPAPRIAIRLRGSSGNTRGVGAQISIAGGPVRQKQEMTAGGHYLSSDDYVRTFATGSASAVDLQVDWPGGKSQLLRNVLPGRQYTLSDTDASMDNPTGTEGGKKPWFSGATAALNHVSIDPAFDDFARQPLLPLRQSTYGPGVGWADLDDDGDEDLLVGNGNGATNSILINNQGSWERRSLDGALANRGDATGLAVFRDERGWNWVTGLSAWENEATNLPAGIISRPNVKTVSSLPVLTSGATAIAGADVDGDGALDLFVGGGPVPGRWPEAAPSQWLTRSNGVWTLKQSVAAGLVRGAVFTDLDGDGKPELALAIEWGPVKLYRFQNGRLEPWDPLVTEHILSGGAIEATPLSRYTGWWTSITAGDFDGDGRMDLVAGNWGDNFRPDPISTTDSAVHLWFGDFGTGLQTVVGSRDEALGRVVPWREWKTVTAQLPWASVAFPDHRSYGQASLEELAGEHRKTVGRLRAEWFATSVFYNRGDRFELRALPATAQLSPVFGLAVADFDGDDRDDLFLAQNFYGTDFETARQDAGIGVLLRNAGAGRWEDIPSRRSGLQVPGEGRGVAVADYDGDGRPDLAVTQRAGSTLLFHNESGPAGVTLRFRGAESNPGAIGTRYWFEDADGRRGPAREVRAGGGWWSQDGAPTVRPAPQLTTLRVRWPHGGEGRYDWPVGVRAVEVDKSGVKITRQR